MEKIKQYLPKILYASLFCIVFPFLLIFWAKSTEKTINLSVPELPLVAIVISTLGFTLICGAMHNLWKRGQGLPMNAFPPKNYVKSGWYYFFHHPIYIGAILLSFGISMYFNSSSGFWLVSPIFILLILAYVLGFENEVIAKAFQMQTHKTFFDFPENDSQKTKPKDQLLLYIWIYLPWFLLYESFIFLGVPKDAISTNITLDQKIPFLDFSVIVYLLVYPLALFTPFILNKNFKTKEFIFDLITGMVIIFYCYLVFPFVVNYSILENTNIFTKIINFGRETDGSTAALPSFHVFWALIVYKYFSWRFPKLKILFMIISFLIILSCLTTKNHTILDVIFGILAYFLVNNRVKIYQFLLWSCEKISNSWHEWRFGKTRIINHGFYAALGGVSGFLIMGYFLPNHLYTIYFIGILGFAGAGLWAQMVEGSPMLLRPFGYYGSVIGIAIATILITVFSDISFWYLLAISTLGASSIQFLGRFRCLVQGCCHGKPTDHVLGIRFCHPKSRVYKIAGWGGKNLYPTQFYSIATNFLTFFLLFRFVSLEMPCSFIAGLYFILNGSSRFVEESLRGEPQTPYFKGMRAYQWLSILSIIMGIIFTTVPSETLTTGVFDLKLLLNSLIYGIIVLFAYGIDFPESNKRFSRLTQ